MFPTNGKAYPVYALSLNARMFMKPKVGWEVALDVISKQAIWGYRVEVEKTQWKIMQFGIYAGYLLPLNQFHFVVGMGAYVRDFYNPDGLLYHRVGMRYYLKNGVYFNLVLKSHWGKADYVEWGVGYKINQGHGYGDFILSGTADNTTIRITSNGFGDASNFKTANQLIVISNTPVSSKINADGAAATVEIEGSGNVIYVGTPQSMNVIQYGTGMGIQSVEFPAVQ
ncbi:hypothetical protein ANCCEY_14987, partial [Ancylostoma ceylanicum]